MFISTTWRRRLGVGLAAVTLGATGLLLLPGAGVAGADDTGDTGDAIDTTDAPIREHPRLTDEQRSCLEEQGVTVPEPGTRPDGPPDAERRAELRDAAEACGIEAPAPLLTDEQRSCLEEQGVTVPEPGTRPDGPPDAERRAELRDAAEACGIDLPRPGARLRHLRHHRLRHEQCAEATGPSDDATTSSSTAVPRAA